jgi:IS66 C-terminal element/Protein of unknown function (DUF429)
VRFVGFDPGGINKFGWAVLESAPQSLQFVAAGICTGVAAVMAEASAALQNQQPAGVGIDAPLFWVQEGDRAADRFVRRLALDAGGERAAGIYSLIGTAKLNGLDCEACLCHVLERIAEYPINRISGLLPWNVAVTFPTNRLAA